MEQPLLAVQTESQQQQVEQETLSVQTESQQEVEQLLSSVQTESQQEVEELV